MVQIGVNHYPRVAGSATGGSFRVIARAMKETIKLWWQMRSYEPPANSPDPRGPYRLGDAIVGAGVASVAGAAIAVKRKLDNAP